MRVGEAFLDGWRPALNKLLVFRDGEAVRQKEWVGQLRRAGVGKYPAVLRLLRDFPAPRGGGCARHSAVGRGAVLFPGPARGSAADPLCRRPILPDEGLRQDGARYGCALSDKLALATGVVAWGPCWRAGVLPTASAAPSLRL